MTSTASTRVFAILGDPVSQSLSPVFQNAAFRHLGLDAVYVALRCSPAAAPALADAIALAGGGGNITVPHKRTVARAIGDATSAMRRTGACNTYWLENGRVRGDNTDVAGFAAALAETVGDIRGARVLLIGAGGAAAAASCAVLDAGADRLEIRNRTRGAAETLRERLDDERVRVREDVTGRYDLVVNATSLGLRDDDPLPIAFADVAGATAAIDVVYRPGGTRWVRAARAAGLTAADGLGMLLHQGAAAFERWWNRDAPLDVMRAALLAAAAGPG